MHGRRRRDRTRALETPTRPLDARRVATIHCTRRAIRADEVSLVVVSCMRDNSKQGRLMCNQSLRRRHKQLRARAGLNTVSSCASARRLALQSIAVRGMPSERTALPMVAGLPCARIHPRRRSHVIRADGTRFGLAEQAASEQVCCDSSLSLLALVIVFQITCLVPLP